MNTNSLGTDKHTFMDIFQATFDNDGESVVLQKIVIPIIQRAVSYTHLTLPTNREV